MVHPLAGQKAPADQLVNLPRLISDYYTAEITAPVAFGTSGHRGSSFTGSFNELHVAAVTQAVVEYRTRQGYTGPLFLGYDTHGLSEAAFRSALEVLAAGNVVTHIHDNGEYTPTPVVSFLIINHNRQNPSALADGLIITPSHNPPQDGGIKYNPPHGGPADVDVTGWIEKRAGELMADASKIKRIPFYKAIAASTTKACDFIRPFARALGDVVDMEAMKGAGLKLAADPLGGSGVHFWEPIAEEWGLNVTVVNKVVDATFSFMTLDSDGVIRMDCSSPYAMTGLIAMGGQYDLAFGNDPDFDRHGIVSGGQLMNPNHYLAVAINYLVRNRPNWPAQAKVGKTLVSSTIIDRVVAAAGRQVYETPVGFKWFVEGLSGGTILFGGEESAGASYLKKDGSTWTTDKDGFCMALLGAEIIARTGKAPHEHYADIAAKYGDSLYSRIDTGVTEAQKAILKNIDTSKFINTVCAGQKVISAYTTAPGNNASIGGLKVVLEDGSWFAMRPSGTEPKLKLYTESFSGEATLKAMAAEAPKLVFG
ncbi:alpha-D-glucose phosphate-specific phosphoglucomutase [Deltaproteobacteria bacterium Smac51]|nr:alpha-D-glucose phosphate-specific phosphoglucomutase [Deltaproteobacteria bacterium Smac51]